MFPEKERHDIIIPVPTTFLEERESKEDMSGIIKNANAVQKDNEPQVNIILLNIKFI